MSNIKKILLSAFATLLLASVLAVPAFCLETHDSIDFGFFAVDGGGVYGFSSGIVPSDAFPTSSDVYTASSIDLYVPFTAVANYLYLKTSFLVNPSTFSLDSYAMSYGYFWPDNTFTDVGVLPVEMQRPGYLNTGYGTIYSYTFKSEVSGVHVGHDTWYLRLRLTGTFEIQLRHDSSSALSLTPTSSSSTLSLSGKTSSVDAVYNPRGGSTYWNMSQNLFTINTTSTGIQYIRLSSSGDTGNLYRMLANGSVAIPSSSVILSGGSPNTSYSGSFSGSSIFGSISPVTLSAVLHSDDSDAVEQLQQINTTLDGMASDLQTITDDFTAREDVGNDIGGTTTDGQISSGISGMSTGSSSLSDGIAGLPSFASIIAPTSGFIGFLTVPMQQIFAFGNGYLLYIATAMVLLSVIFWVVKRMGGDGD